MSLHESLTGCLHRDTTNGREVYWKAACECGWEGQEFDLSAVPNAARYARREYREHVESTLGAGAYYTASVACRNCGSEHEQGVLIGTHVTANPCVRCGTTMLNPSNDAWHESRAESKRWGW